MTPRDPPRVRSSESVAAYRFETYHSECHYLEQSLPPALRAEGLHRSMFIVEQEVCPPRTAPNLFPTPGLSHPPNTHTRCMCIVSVGVFIYGNLFS